MTWDQIENKWAAMTLRVRADWPTGKSEGDALAGKVPPPDRGKPGRTTDPQAGVAADKRPNMSIA